MSEYSDEFYGKYQSGAQLSAQVVVPMILDLVSPRSALDVGCGTGSWLAEFRERGVEDICGLDGAWVPLDRLQIPLDRFGPVDLAAPGTLPRRFDVALCLEVAEHVDEAGAKGLIEFLTAASSVVVFSAAVPGQGGTGHVNEQWLDYWQEIFTTFGYRLFDPIRAQVWDNPSVEPWYAQNLVVFADQRAEPALLDRLTIAHELNTIRVNAIHPGMRTAVYG